MRVALYARVSTKSHGQDPETQLIPLREFAKHRGWDIVEEYKDLGWSGSKERRPQLDRLMQDAARGRFSCVAVWKFDRFARSTKHLLTALATFHSQQIEFVSISESIDTSTAVGKMVFTILGAVAEMERSLIRERVQAGVERAKRQGVKLGRPTVLVDHDRIREQATSGMSISAIARGAGIARGTVRAILGKNAKQAGGKSLPSGAL